MIALLGTVLGVIGSIITVLFIETLEWLQTVIWTTIPSQLNVSAEHSLYVVACCTIGGVLVGLSVKYLGNYPKNLVHEMKHFKKSKTFDYHHIPQTIINSLLSLGFGAALGPEAALTSIVGGLGTWISTKLKAVSSASEQIGLSGMSATVTALYGSPLAGAVANLEPQHTKRERLLLFIGGGCAAASAFLVFRLLLSGGTYFNMPTEPYTLQGMDMFKAVVPALFGIVLALLFNFTHHVLFPLCQKINSTVLKATVGGLIFGVLAAIVPLMLFSGHNGTEQLMTTYAATAGGLLLVITVSKIFATNLLLATGWKGGQFFPVMFIGAAGGLAISALIPTVPSMVGLVSGMTAMLAVVLKKPIFSGLIVVFFFPPNLYPVMIVSVLCALLFLRTQKSTRNIT